MVRNPTNVPFLCNVPCILNEEPQSQTMNYSQVNNLTRSYFVHVYTLFRTLNLSCTVFSNKISRISKHFLPFLPCARWKMQGHFEKAEICSNKASERQYLKINIRHCYQLLNACGCIQKVSSRIYGNTGKNCVKMSP